MIRRAFGVGTDVIVEVWSDVICPWCYIGKRRLESALAGWDGHAEVVWRSFELAPGAPAEREGSMVSHLARKYGMSPADAEASVERLTRLAAAEGLEYHLDRAKAGNTFDAHRVLHLAGPLQGAVKEALMRAYFTEGRAIGLRSTVVSVAASCGLPADELSKALEGDAAASEVRADEERAMELGISGVPFFLFDRRVAVPGAQEPAVLLDALRRASQRVADRY